MIWHIYYIIWHDIYDMTYMSYHIWYDIYDITYMMWHIWYDIYDMTCMKAATKHTETELAANKHTLVCISSNISNIHYLQVTRLISFII